MAKSDEENILGLDSIDDDTDSESPVDAGGGKQEPPAWLKDHKAAKEYAGGISPDDMAILKRVAPFMLDRLKRDKLFHAKAKVNPNLHMEGAKRIALDKIFSKYRDAWGGVEGSDEYKDASLPKQLRMQRDFKKRFFEDNPEHGVGVHQEYHDAMKDFHKATHAHRQEKHEVLRDHEIGGGVGDMTAKEAGAHFGHKSNKGDEDDVDTASTFSGGAGAADPASVAAARKRLGNINIPEEYRDVSDREGKSNLGADIPMLKDPKVKKVVNDFMKKYAYMMEGGSPDAGAKKSSFMDKAAEKLGIKGGIDNVQGADAPALAMAVQYGIWKALKTHKPEGLGGANLHNWIYRQAMGNVQSAIRNTHSTKFLKPKKKESAPVVRMNEIPQEEIDKLNTAANAVPAPAGATPILSPAATPSSPVSPPPVVPEQPKISNHEDYAHLVPESKPDIGERLKNVTVARNIIRRPKKPE